MDEDLCCAICQEAFDTHERTPRMLPCGHTYCQHCLAGLFARPPVLCPEDRSAVPVESVADLAKNFSLLRVIQKKQDVPAPIDPSAKCPEHRKKLEYVCLDDKVKICANCALFGRHRGHNVRAEDEVMREVTIRAECLLEMLQIIEHSQANVLDDQVNKRLEDLNQRHHAQKTEIEAKLQHFFADIHSKLADLENSTRQTLSKHFNSIESTFLSIKDTPQQVNSQTSAWIQAAKEQLDRLSVASDDPRFIDLDVLEGSNELFQSGEKVLGELETLKDLPIAPLEELIQGVAVEYSEGLLSGLVKVRIGPKAAPPAELRTASNPEVSKSVAVEEPTRKPRKVINESIFEEAMDALRLHTTETADFSGAGGSVYAELKDRAAQVPPLVASNFCLKSLKFVKNAVPDETVEALCTVLQDNTTLQTLHLSQNASGPVALEALVYMLNINTTLREINLMGNPKMTHEYRAKFAAMSNKFRKVYI